MGSAASGMVHHSCFSIKNVISLSLQVKFLLFGIQLYYSEALELFGEFMLADFKDNPKVELVFVMVILPVTLNSIQVCSLHP